MDDDEELKNQCFGGDYSGEVNPTKHVDAYVFIHFTRVT